MIKDIHKLRMLRDALTTIIDYEVTMVDMTDIEGEDYQKKYPDFDAVIGNVGLKFLDRYGVWWCNSHGREATHKDRRGRKCCDPKLGGIMLPCEVVFKELEAAK